MKINYIKEKQAEARDNIKKQSFREKKVLYWLSEEELDILIAQTIQDTLKRVAEANGEEVTPVDDGLERVFWKGSNTHHKQIEDCLTELGYEE